MRLDPESSRLIQLASSCRTVNTYADLVVSACFHAFVPRVLRYPASRPWIATTWFQTWFQARFQTRFQPVPLRAACRFLPPAVPTVARMITFPDADPDSTRLLVRAIAGAVAMAASGEYIELDLSGIRETEHAARKVAVAEHLRATMVDLEAVIRAKTAPPAQASAAVLGSRLVANGEVFDAAANTYAPGPGFATLLKAAAADADAAAAERAR